MPPCCGLVVMLFSSFASSGVASVAACTGNSTAEVSNPAINSAFLAFIVFLL
jgi:hypothetical protein